MPRDVCKGVPIGVTEPDRPTPAIRERRGGQMYGLGVMESTAKPRGKRREDKQQTGLRREGGT